MSGPAADPQGGRLWVRWGLDPVSGAIDGVLLDLTDSRTPRAERRARPPSDLPAQHIYDQHVLTPGLLNAHAHLDYSYLKDTLPRGQGFSAWLREMIRARRSLDPANAKMEIERVRLALDATIADGVTEIWDIASFGWARPFLAESALRSISFVEFLAPAIADWEQRWKQWRAEWESRRARPGLGEAKPLNPENRLAPILEPKDAIGLSLHAPYTVCPPALATAARWAADHHLALAIHLAESPEEAELLAEGLGSLFDLLREVSGGDPVAELGAGASPIRRAEAAGILGPGTLAIHCNLPATGDVRRLADSGAVVVICPRSHVFFGYPPYPIADYTRAGIPLALGTDSLASNDSVSIHEEARALAAIAPNWPPTRVLACATGATLGDTLPFGNRGRLLSRRLNEGADYFSWAIWEIESAPTRSDAESLATAWLARTTRCAGSSAGARAMNESAD